MATRKTGMMHDGGESGKMLSIDTQDTAPMPSASASPSPSASPTLQSSMSHSKPAVLETPTASHPFDYPSPSPPPMQPLPNLPSIDSVHTRGLSLASTTSKSSVKRKPLPINAKPLAIRYSTDYESSRGSFETPGPRFYRNPSIDSPTLWEAGLFKHPGGDSSEEALGRQRSPTLSKIESELEELRPRSLHTNSSSSNYQSDRDSIHIPRPLKKSSTDATLLAVDASDATARRDSAISSGSHTTQNYYEEEDTSLTAGRSRPPSTMSLFSSKPAPPNLGPTNTNAGGAHFDANSIKHTDKPLPRSPSAAKSPGASKLGSFFGWGGQTSPASSHTTFSEDRTEQEDRTFSPLGSPLPSPKDFSRSADSRQTPGAIDISAAHYGDQGYFDDPYPPTPGTPSDIGDMEEELRTISSELATSIRREMELEDLVERLQADLETPRNTANRRTSDYFSDSGNSSLAKYGGDLDARADEVDRSLRKAERDKAQVRLDCQEKVEEERSKRKALEKQIRQLEEKASQVDLLSINSIDTTSRLRDLEATCESLRRHLSEEKQAKENYEDLLTALKGDLEASHGENENLKDEIIPQLRARVEGLEAQAIKQEKLAYEMQQEMQSLREENDELNRKRSTQDDHHNPVDGEQQQELVATLEKDLYHTESERNHLRDEVVPTLKKRVDGLEVEVLTHKESEQQIQQQMQTLKNENFSLSSARVAQADMQRHMDSIGEDETAFVPSGLKRSSSVTRSIHGGTPMRSRPSSMTFNKGIVIESRDMLAERVKDVEAQRDALHRALKSLLERQEYQNKENDKKLRQLEMERDRALKIRDATGRAGYDREVINLRAEINTLRLRADEAIEQKWQCEKGLGGLKMDLDRAQQEIESLKSLLEDGGAAKQDGMRDSSRNSHHSGSLEQAYRELQKSYENSLERVRALESQMPKDEETERALKQLEQSLSDAINERDFAIQEAETYRLSVESLKSNEQRNAHNEIQLADELLISAQRVEELAAQVRNQLASNASLRERLAETIERGDREQKSNAARINHMQGKLRTLEEALMTAQHKSEDSVMKHEEEISNLKNARNSQLVRIKEKLQSPRVFSPDTKLSPLFSGARSPKVDFTSTGKAMSIFEETQMKFLKKRVEELERALEEADGEMEEVVGRMNVAQIEVMELQNEREESVRLTRKLQKQIEEEKMRGFEERFKTLSS